MKYIIPTLSLITLAAASAVAQTAPAAKAKGLNSDRVGLTYDMSGDIDYMTVSTAAALGDYLVASANYVDVGGDIAGLSVDGRLVTIGLAAKAAIGSSGELSVGYRYGIGAIVVSTIAGDIGEQDALILAYRHSLGNGLEVGLSVSKLDTETVSGDVDVTPVTLSARYNVGMVDFTLAYSTEDAYGLQEGEDNISLGVGINF